MSGQKRSRKEKKRAPFLAPAILAVCAVLFTILVRVIDVAEIGPQNTSVGFSKLNGMFREAVGVHMLWYHITKWLGAFAIFVALLFAVAGLAQWLRSKKISRVDRRIRYLGVAYLMVIVLYVFFEIVTINYRPVIMPGESAVEASFPSSHTMLACVVFGTAATAGRKYLRRYRLQTPCRWLCVFLLILTVGGRLVSGVHWFTDIFAGVLYSAAIVTFFRAMV